MSARPRLGRPGAAHAALALLALACLLAPALASAFWVSQILTRALWLGIAALSLTFLASCGGMVSLAQVGLSAVAGFTFANLVSGLGGLALGWGPWPATAAALALATLAGLLFGAIACRSYGIYFLMITLALTVIVYYLFGQATALGGFGGIRSVATPRLVGDPITHPAPLYYVSLVAAGGCYLGLRALARTPFGLALQGIRDDPRRMGALGYHVALHRTLAFALGALVAAISGVLSTWWVRQISPGTVDVGQAIDVLTIAVIGGLYRLEGAFVGALFYVLLDNYARDVTPSVGSWLGPGRFSTVLGVVFLAIVALAPNGLLGLGGSALTRLGRTRPRAAERS